MDITEKAEAFDKLAATLRAVATARPKKELSYVVADFEDMMSLASRFKVGGRGAGNEQLVLDSWRRLFIHFYLITPQPHILLLFVYIRSIYIDIFIYLFIPPCPEI